MSPADRPAEERPTATGGRRRVDRDRRLNDAVAAAAAAGGVVERTEKLLAAREGASCREGIFKQCVGNDNEGRGFSLLFYFGCGCYMVDIFH